MTYAPSPWAEDGLSRRCGQDVAASLPAKVSQHELIARPPAWLTNPTGWQTIFVLCAGVFASLAITCLLFALRVRQHRWFSDRQWFENENDLLNDTDRLKRYHVLAMHGINQQMGYTNEQKANWIFMAQLFLALAALSIAVILWVPTLLRGIPLLAQWLRL